MNIRPDHAGISVADLEASIAWYRDMLGFELDRVVDIPEGTGKVAMIHSGDFILELFCFPGAAPLPEEQRHPATGLSVQGSNTWPTLCPTAALMDELKAKDVDLVWDIVIHEGTPCAFVRDNTGNLVEFVERS